MYVKHVRMRANATTQKYNPRRQEESTGDPADIQRLPEFPTLGVDEQWVVKVSNDGVSRPRDWNDNTKRSQDLHHPHGHHNDAFDPRLISETGGATETHQGHQQAQSGERQSAAGQPAGGLQVWWEEEQRVVHFTLHVNVGLSEAGHPQALPADLHDDDVLSDEGRHLPHGESCDGGRADQTNDAQTQSDQFTLALNHRSPRPGNLSAVMDVESKL